MIDLETFVAKKRKKHSEEHKPIEGKPLPWYRRPIEKSDFITKTSNDGKFYIHHREWSEHTWIGPYKDDEEANEIIESYVTESLKDFLDKKPNERIHSVIIDSAIDFFS